jgi:hypothetical protein
MRVALLLGSLLLIVSASANAELMPPQETSTQIVNETVQAAGASLGNAESGARLSLSEAERLVEACNDLAELDPRAHETYCSGNPAVQWSMAHLSLATTKLSPRTRRIFHAYATREQRSGSSEPEKDDWLTLPSDPDSRQALSSALSTEIDYLSVSFQRSAERGNIHKRLGAEAKLNILYRDLREALGEKSSLLPSDPLSLAGEDALNVEIRSCKAYRNRLSRFIAKFPLPDSTETLQSLDNRIDRLNALIESDQPGRFHRARDSIEASLDVARWNHLLASRAGRFSAEQRRLESDWSQQYPALALVPNPRPSVVFAGDTGPQQQLSERVLEATRSYEIDPARWLALESSLMATYAQIDALPGPERRSYTLDPMPSYQQWRASVLMDQDLVLALEYSLAASNNRSALSRGTDTELPFAPDLFDKKYRVQLTQALHNEYDNRKAAPRVEHALPAVAARRIGIDPEIATDLSPTERLFRVRLAEGRYDSPNEMPPLVMGEISKYIQEVHDRDLQKGIRLYSRLQRWNEVAALSSHKLSDGELSRLSQARLDTLAALLALESVIRARERQGYSWQGDSRSDLSVMIASLTIRPPPDDPKTGSPLGGTSPPSAPNGPSDGASGSHGEATELGTAPLMHDAHLIALFAKASSSIENVELPSKTIDLEPANTATEKGRITVLPDDFTKLDKDFSKTRLPDSLKSWKGLANSDSGKPYDYQLEVKNFKDLKYVGGGIHFGDKGVLSKSSQIDHSILTYEESSKSLLLLRPSGEALRYGPIEPADLKALYQFVVANRNAAVSIGWAGVDDPDIMGAGDSQPVLLDPYFVDTRIGQDLVQADSIPWALDAATLAGGHKNPIATQFKAEKENYFAGRYAMLQKLCSGVPAFSESYANQMAEQFKGSALIEAATSALLVDRSVEAARTSFLRQTHYTALKRNRDKLSSELLQPEQKPQNVPSSSLLPDPLSRLQTDPPSNPQNNPFPSVKKSPFSAPVDRPKDLAQLKEDDDLLKAITFFRDLFDHENDRLALLQYLADLRIRAGNADAKWMRLLVSIVKKSKRVPDDKLGEAVYESFTTTLAVLLDEPTEISVDKTTLRLTGRMRYRYASSYFRVENEKLVTEEQSAGGINRVETIEPLTSLANRAMPALVADCPSLRNVSNYAEIAGFLRWARQSKGIIAIDFSTLSDFATSDRDKTPTPDALAKRKSTP